MFSNSLHRLFNFLNILKKYGLNAQWVKNFTIYLNEDMEEIYFKYDLVNVFVTERQFLCLKEFYYFIFYIIY